MTSIDIPTIQATATESDYHALNAAINLYNEDGKLQLEKDKEAARSYFLNHINPSTTFFYSLEEKLDFLFENEYYEREVFDQYDFETQIKPLYKRVYEVKHRFSSFLGALKFYNQYALKTFDGQRYLERFEDRVAANALYLGNGDYELALSVADEMIHGRYQPATPTFQNAGKKQRGEPVSCFLIRTEDNLESIMRSVQSAAQLSKRGGGVGINLTNIREAGAPIKKMEGQSSGVVPFAKTLDNVFVWINQLGQRNGAGVVYLNVFHPDVETLLDSKRENADELVRLKTLSIGLMVPDIMFELARNNEPMYQFSPYDVEREYGIPFSDISVTEKYREMVDNHRIRKRKTNARELFQIIAEISAESGYPYLIFEDTANRGNPIEGRINMSNLCVEIMQVNEPSTYNADGSYAHVGRDISCNLGSLVISSVFQGGDMEKSVEIATRALSVVSDLSDISSVPSIARGNSLSHAIGLGVMNYHGFLMENDIEYGSEESVDFTNVFFSSLNYYSLKASNKIAQDRGETFHEFEKSDYADGSYFAKYTQQSWGPKTAKVREVFDKYGIAIPSRENWQTLEASVREHGLYNAYRLAVAPNGSISYVQHATSSIHPITSLIESRSEGGVGTVYYGAYGLTNENKDRYKDAYQIGPEKLIDVYAAAAEHIDQSLSMTLFFDKDATSRTVVKAHQYAWKAGVKSIYYARFQRDTIDGMEDPSICVSCSI